MDTAETGRWHFCPERDGAKRPSKKVFVIGCGRWGTFIAWYLQKLGHCVTLYGRPGSKNMQALQATGRNEYVALDGQVALTCALDGLQGHDILVISVNAQGLQQLMDELRPYNLKNLSIVLCMKGVEIATGRRLSQVVAENVDPSNGIAVWLGPGHVEDFCRGIPNCMVIDSANQTLKQALVEDFSSELIRFYYGTDLIGNEIGAAAKNVMGIAAGMLDGLAISALKGPLMARGPREIARLIRAMGGSELTAYGLCHLGDYEATLFSAHSHNRTFGEHFILQKPYAKLAEGYYTVEALVRLGDRYGVELPICSAVYDILYRGQAATAVLNHLFRRELTEEFC